MSFKQEKHYIFKLENKTRQLRQRNDSEIVEVYNGVDTWGYICPGPTGYRFTDGWTRLVASPVICRQLGYADSLAMVTLPTVDGAANLYLSHIECLLPETAMSINDPSCLFGPIDRCTCYDNRVVGVICSGKYTVSHRGSHLKNDRDVSA